MNSQSAMAVIVKNKTVIAMQSGGAALWVAARVEAVDADL